MKKYLILEYDAGTIAFHYEVLHPLYSGKNIIFAQKHNLAIMLGERIILHLRFTNTPGQLSELAEEAVSYEIIF